MWKKATRLAGLLALTSGLALSAHDAVAFPAGLTNKIGSISKAPVLNSTILPSNKAEARLWLVFEGPEGPEGGGAGASSGGDSATFRPFKGKRKSNIKPWALQTPAKEKKKKLPRLTSKKYKGGKTISSKGFKAIQNAFRNAKNPSIVTLPNTGKKKGGFRTIGSANSKSSKSPSNFAPSSISSWNPAARPPTVVSIRNPGGRKGASGRNIGGFTPVAAPNRVGIPGGRAARGGGGSRSCYKFVTVVVDGVPRRVKVKTSGGC